MSKQPKISSNKQGGKKKKSARSDKNSEGRLQLLQERFDGLTLTLKERRQKHKRLIADNEWLQNEMDRIKDESSQYAAVLDKRANNRLTMIVSLSDQNEVTLKEIRQRQAELLQQFDDTKQQLKDELVQKEALVIKKKSDLAALQTIQSVKADQETHIATLEREVQERRQECTRRLEERKRTFFVERQRLVDEAGAVVATRSRLARREAEQVTASLARRTHDHNIELRTELNELLRRNRALHHTVRDLSHQRRQLLNKRHASYGSIVSQHSATTSVSQPRDAFLKLFKSS